MNRWWHHWHTIYGNFAPYLQKLIHHTYRSVSTFPVNLSLGKGTASEKAKKKETYDQNEHVTVEPVQGGHPEDARKVTTPDRSTATKVTSTPEQRPDKVVFLFLSWHRGSVALAGVASFHRETGLYFWGGRRRQVWQCATYAAHPSDTGDVYPSAVSVWRLFRTANRQTASDL